MADAELVKEIMVDLGESLAALGFNVPLEQIEGHGAIGRAVRNARTRDNLKLVALYLKDIAKTLQNHPQKSHPKIIRAKQLLGKAWAELKEAAED